MSAKSGILWKNRQLQHDFSSRIYTVYDPFTALSHLRCILKETSTEGMISMKKLLAIVLICALLTGCGAKPAETAPSTSVPETTAPTEAVEVVKEVTGDIVDILLEGQNITVSGDAEGVYTSRDIIYYEDKEVYDSGNPYGEGEDYDRHTKEEANAHLVVNITAPGNYRLSGKLDLGQIRIDLGEDADKDLNAVVNLILDGVDINCEVGPAILFLNVYECDGDASPDTARPDVDTTAAGANLILAENSRNTVTGAYVAKIFKDQEEEKKLWKQDGAIYSYMSMNVYGPGSLDLYAKNEGLDTELHLTIWSGDISIRSGNDGINTNEDGISVTTIRGGSLRITAGLGEEGDGIDSNGYLVIRGGTVISAANPASDAGLDSDLGSFIHGGTVVALGSAMDWAESDSGQVTINAQFAQMQTGDIRIFHEDGTEVFSFSPAADPVLKENIRSYQGAVLSCPGFRVGDVYTVFVDGLQMAYTGTDVMMGPGGFGNFAPGQRPENGPPEDREPGQTPPDMPQGTAPSMPEGEMPTRPEGEMPSMPQEPPQGFGNPGGEGNTLFVMQDKVNFFSGLTLAE